MCLSADKAHTVEWEIFAIVIVLLFSLYISTVKILLQQILFLFSNLSVKSQIVKIIATQISYIQILKISMVLQSRYLLFCIMH